ncbi:twin-arginine translocation pathway signal protein [Sulfitobacter sp. S223]|uniref:twin-arginine translocation pathway signal protein n=1 Tax=Sulfitobacter sp. S223 TaxID=2867023 RepID=UPI0021A4D80C|nr:twin-arginine translocation pathway signal protein [Sulfitobacter sp. S223]UWR25688.1 twin-arginine translocation pathway signal protein [Sulfitobacter sp. S223]
MTRKTDISAQPQPSKGRRDFLKFAGTAAPLVAVAVAGSGGQAQAAAAEADPSSERMQDTEHTRAYYESARF